MSSRTKGDWDYVNKTCPCKCFGEDQHNWHALCDRYDGNEDEARKELVRQLRQAADIIESKSWPDVFGCHFHKTDKPCVDSFIETVSVTLSYPWPG